METPTRRAIGVEGVEGVRDEARARGVLRPCGR